MVESKLDSSPALEQLLNEPNAQGLTQLGPPFELLDLVEELLIDAIDEDRTPWEIVSLARHKERPQTRDYLGLVFDDFFELHGDKHWGDDPAMVTGFACLDGFKVLVVGHCKGRTTKERMACHFGCANPEGYRKALRKMNLAAKFGLPIVTLIDTPGAYPGIAAEERGQAQAIADNLLAMSQLPVPIICAVIGEGGSGGALGIGIGDRIVMLQYAYYSVISPEGCAGILWKDRSFAPQAARKLQLTAPDLLQLGVVDDILPEPAEGAHTDWNQAANELRKYLLEQLSQLKDVPAGRLINLRYAKFRKIGSLLADEDLRAN